MDRTQTYQDALAAIEGLPQRTRDIEQAVHGHAVAVHLVARALRITEAEVKEHLQAAREARAGLASAGCAGENGATKPTSLERAIILVGEGMKAREIAAALGCRTGTVHEMLSRARSRGAKIAFAGAEARRARDEQFIALARSGLSPVAVASACGCKPGIVYLALSRARARGDDLRVHLESIVQRASLRNSSTADAA